MRPPLPIVGWGLEAVGAATPSNTGHSLPSASLPHPGFAGGGRGGAGRRGQRRRCHSGCHPKARARCRGALPAERMLRCQRSPGGAPTPLPLQVMPQFTFACFCGLHGFCKMKRKKEEPSAEQETAV
ncbi:bladder cancer associated transcript 1 isoform 1-T1 [Chlamydotis macqueenii]